ncbi:MAG: threonine ammonia-lyase IlvA [bacterium]
MKITRANIDEAAGRLKSVVSKTPLQYNKRLSEEYHAAIYFKREDLQEVRSFKIRGAYNKMSSLSEGEKKRCVVCASAGNHAQGVALSCFLLKTKGIIFMPTVTPNQKIEKVRNFGKHYIEVKLVGANYDEASKASKEYAKEINAVYVSAFDDEMVIAGQGTIGKEIYEDLPSVDVVVSQIGGGGLIGGIASYIKSVNKNSSVIGVQASGAAGMYVSVQNNKVTPLKKIDTFVEGTAVGMVSDLTLSLTRECVDNIVCVPEGKVCTTMIELYQSEGIITEPAGALAVSALDSIKENIKNKTVVCIVSGGNNDIMRYQEILERSLVYQGRKHYFIIEFAQKPGQLKTFLNHALGKNDDIVLFEYIKKNNKEKGPALVGIELKDRADYDPLIERMNKNEINFKLIHSDDLLFNYLI